MVYLHLLLAFLQIGAFSFGGGYAAMPLIQDQVIGRYHWMTSGQFSDLVTISQMTPGPIAVNAATFVGNQVAGIPGALAATIGVILPSCVFVTLIAWLYQKYRNLSVMQGVLGFLRPVVVALIFSAGLDILVPAITVVGKHLTSLKNVDLRMALYVVAALFLLRKTKIGPIRVMCLFGAAELLVQALLRYAG